MVRARHLGSAGAPVSSSGGAGHAGGGPIAIGGKSDQRALHDRLVGAVETRLVADALRACIRQIASGSGQQALHFDRPRRVRRERSEEHTSELQSLMRISYAVFCLKKKKTRNRTTNKSRQMNK